ncbi:SufS family cysteine desulfurase [Thalassotalea euphylliae]|uniref:SufS family cysteine desulfurase n=1 Tax=Thalassotalea euphylliae TaxID=1655234 RepID=UPI0036407F69
MKIFSVNTFRNQFPIFSNDSPNRHIIYFDNAATTQKPSDVITAESLYYQSINANVHRASHQLSALATEKFEAARLSAQCFINANSCAEVIWTKGTTEGINIVASSWGMDNLTAGDEILLSHSEHHANIVPWQQVAEQTGALIKVMPLNTAGEIDLNVAKTLISSRTKMVSFAMVSNVVGKHNPVTELIALAKSVNAKVLLDAAQVVAHQKVDVRALDCDFLVFSAHKMFGPTGVGVLYGKAELLNKMSPYQFGGEMIKKVSFSGTSFGELPFKFEPGTPNIAGVVAMAKAIETVETLIASGGLSHEQILLNRMHSGLSQIPQINLIFDGVPSVPVFSFTVTDHHHQDLASYLDAHNVACRAGHHCAMPLMEYLGLSGCVRLSLSPYNTLEEVDATLSLIKGFFNAETPDEQKAQTPNASQSVIDKFSDARGWDGRHRIIMLLGKELKRMPKEERSNELLIDGCESAAWLKATNKNGVWHFSADSDAKVIRGLLVIILAVYQHQTSDFIRSFDIDSYFEELGLMQQLSPSRGNGVVAIVNRIKQSTAG